MEHVNRHFEQREVVIADRPMVYRRSAAPVRPREAGGCEVVLVHGLGLSGRYMLPLAVCLAADHALTRWIAASNPVGGRSRQRSNAVPDRRGDV